MKASQENKSDYDGNGEPKPEAIRRALEKRKPIPWWGIVCLAFSIPGLVAFGLKPLVGDQAVFIITSILFACVVAYVNSATMRRITARLARWTGLLL